MIYPSYNTKNKNRGGDDDAPATSSSTVRACVKRSRIRESRSRRGTCATDDVCVVDLPNTTTHQTAGMRPPGLTTILLRNPTNVSPTVVCEASHNAMDVASVWIGLVSKTKANYKCFVDTCVCVFCAGRSSEQDLPIAKPRHLLRRFVHVRAFTHSEQQTSEEKRVLMLFAWSICRTQSYTLGCGDAASSSDNDFEPTPQKRFPLEGS